MTLRGLIRITLVLAVAVFTGLLLRSLFIASNAQPPQPRPVDVASVATASRVLPKGLLLREDDFAWREMPQDRVSPTMIAKGSERARHLAGAVVLHPIAEGGDINRHDLVFPDAPGFLAAALAPGMRAVSVAIDDVTGNAGLILPGDRVDLLLTQKLDDHESRAPSRVASEIVLADLRVIAVGSQMQVSTPDKPPSRPAHTVTLEVTPGDAEKISVATRLGQLSLALRSLASPRPEDGAPLADGVGAEAVAVERADKPTWGEDVSMAIRQQAKVRPAPVKAGAPQAATVKVFRGSQNMESGLRVGAAAAPEESRTPR